MGKEVELMHRKTLHFEIIFSPDFLADIILSDENSDVFTKNRKHIVFAIPQTDRFISVIQLLLGWIETKVTEHKLLLRHDQVKHFLNTQSKLIYIKGFQHEVGIAELQQFAYLFFVGNTG